MAKRMTLDDLTKSNIWTISEAELNTMLTDGKKKDGFTDNEAHYMNIIRSVFDIKYFDREDEDTKKKLEDEQYDLFYAPSEGENNAIAIKKKKIVKITDLTLENVSHLVPEDILSLIQNNMGTGWNGLPLAIQDIIQSAFYVDSSQMPEAAIHRKGGLINRRKEDGYEVLEIPRGSWIEAIFVKLKPKMEKVKFKFAGSSYSSDNDEIDEEDDDDDNDIIDDTKDSVPNEDEIDEDVNEEEQEPSIEEIDVIDDDTDDSDDEE